MKDKYKVARKRRSTYRRRKFPMGNPSVGLLFENKKHIRLSWSQLITIDPPIGGLATPYLFISNGLFDPNYTSGNPLDPQPMMFDQLMGFYKKATVMTSKITATFCNSHNNPNYLPYIMGIRADPANTAFPVDYNVLMTGVGTTAKIGAFAHQAHYTVTNTYNAKRDMNVRDPLDEPNLANDVGNNPLTPAYFNVFAGAFDQSSNMDPVKVRVSIEFWTVWTKPINPLPS